MTTHPSERRTPAALAVKLPDSIAMVPRIVMGDSETMSALAFCEDHTNWGGGQPPNDPDLTACWNCFIVETQYEVLAELIRDLLAGREQMAKQQESFHGEVVGEIERYHALRHSGLDAESAGRLIGSPERTAAYERILGLIEKATSGQVAQQLTAVLSEPVAEQDPFSTESPDCGSECVCTTPLIDPDCRDGKCDSCVGGPCEHECHTRKDQS